VSPRPVLLPLPYGVRPPGPQTALQPVEPAPQFPRVDRRGGRLLRGPYGPGGSRHPLRQPRPRAPGGGTGAAAGGTGAGAGGGGTGVPPAVWLSSVYAGAWSPAYGPAPSAPYALPAYPGAPSTAGASPACAPGAGPAGGSGS